MILLYVLTAIARSLLAPFCPCGTEPRAMIAWDSERVTEIRVACDPPMREFVLVPPGADPWEVK